MSGGNSWTIVTSEETVAETLKPSTGGDHHEESHTSAAGSGETAGPANGAASAEALHVDDYLVSEEKPAELSGDSSTAVTESPVTSCFKVSASLVHCDDEVNNTLVLPEDQAQSSPDPDSFSDSYTHVTPSPDEPTASALSTETLGSAEFSPEVEKLSLEATLHPLNGEKLHQDEEESDCYSRTTDLGKQAEHAPDSEAAGEKTAEEEEPEVRKRRSLLAALEQIGQREEDEAEEEEYRLPQRDDDSGFSVNKCILGAVILLGLGTIFFSESDYNTRELKEAAAAGKQEWLNPEVPPHQVDADSSELLNKLAEGNEQISVLQAQLQAQKDELKVAMGHAAEGATERQQWEEVEKENTPHTEPAPVQPATSPPGGQPEDSRPETAASEDKRDRKQLDERKGKKKDLKRDKHDMGEKKDWKEREKSVWKEGEKREHRDGGKTERKKVIHEFDKEREGKPRREETKHWKEKDRKKDKDRSSDEGKPWKNRDGKKEWREKSDREWKEEKDGKKVKSEKVNEGKQWRGKGEDKDWKSGKEWKKTKDGFKEGGKDRKEWKVKGEKKEWKNENGKEGKGRGERKQWEGRMERPSKEERNRQEEHEWKSKNGKHDKEWKRKDKRFEEEDWKRGGQKEKKHHGDGVKDKSKKERFRDDHLYGDQKQTHSHRKPSVGQPEYWVQQKDRLHHDPTPPQQCDSVETCAQQERLRPVPLAEFDAILQTYLTKAAEAGVEQSRMEELQKLIPEFFQDGVFVHDKISFQDFVEDVADILEDMVEVDENSDEEDSAIEEELEAFEREVMKTFLVAGDKEKRMKGEWRKESVPGRG